MTLFAKILTIVNVLAAIAFLVIAGKDYGIRQSWARAVFLHEIAIHGLPVDDTDDSWRPGTPIAKDLSPGLLKDIYGSAPGEQFRTQQQELERVKDDILGIVDSAPNDNAKRMELASYLLPLMQSGEERDRFLGFLQQRSRTPIQDLRDALVFRIDSALAPVGAGEGRQSLETKRREIAHLLYNLNPTADVEQRKRVQAVIGLEEYVREASSQASNLIQMAQRVQAAIGEEQAIFIRQHEALIPQLHLLSDQLKAKEAWVKEQKKLSEQYTGLLNSRKAEADELGKQLDTATKEAAAEMVALAAVQKQLFDLQRDLARVVASNQGLERQIRDKELGAPREGRSIAAKQSEGGR